VREPHGLRGLSSYVLLTSWQLVATAILFGLDAVSLIQGHSTPLLALLAAAAGLLALRYMWLAQVNNLDRIGLETLSGLVQFRLIPAAFAWWCTAALAGVVTLAVPAATGAPWLIALPLLAGLATVLVTLAAVVVAIVVWRTATRDLGRARTLLATMRKEVNPSELARVEKWVAWQAGEADDSPPERIRGAYFPGLAVPPWPEREQYPWVQKLESSTPAIISELDAQAAVRFEDEAYLNSSTREWRAGYLTKRFVPVAENRARLPLASSLLDEITGGLARDAMISRLDPGGFIERHRDPGNIFITCHLGLKIPKDCGIHVAGETRTWSEGRCLFFDSSREHYAFNRSETARMILLFDFLNPSLTATEQAFFRRYYGALAA